MDKLQSVLNGEEARKDNKTVLQTVNEASTLGWGTRLKGFVACFVVGGVCTVLGVCLLFLPRIGIILFIVFYTLGNLCTLGRSVVSGGFILKVQSVISGHMCHVLSRLAKTQAQTQTRGEVGNKVFYLKSHKQKLKATPTGSGQNSKQNANRQSHKKAKVVRYVSVRQHHVSDGANEASEKDV
ncbi:SFT2 domain containing 2a isoform X1 [Anarrhichthys ocellatus]|uniref:SFT2 domain containing 2a isoform X1 n=1 Tax=Anarrhichthys ocellatus TaxID=433405 RepID=UPI0012ECF5AD|nr:uncharacterized protein LOC116377622 isoform X1 [Anarrhichthys ocellatus]